MNNDVIYLVSVFYYEDGALTRDIVPGHAFAFLDAARKHVENVMERFQETPRLNEGNDWTYHKGSGSLGDWWEIKTEDTSGAAYVYRVEAIEVL